jgi:hypothetical protein
MEERDIPKTILVIRLIPADACCKMEHTRLGGRKLGGIHLLIINLQALQDMLLTPKPVKIRNWRTQMTTPTILLNWLDPSRLIGGYLHRITR